MSKVCEFQALRAFSFVVVGGVVVFMAWCLDLGVLVLLGPFTVHAHIPMLSRQHYPHSVFTVVPFKLVVHDTGVRLSAYVTLCILCSVLHERHLPVFICAKYLQYMLVGGC